jgi:hypothetical protein
MICFNDKEIEKMMLSSQVTSGEPRRKIVLSISDCSGNGCKSKKEIQ